MEHRNKSTSILFDRKKLLWMLIFILIAAMTIFAVMSHSDVFTMKSFTDYLSESSKSMLIVAAFASFGFVFFEGAALATILCAFGYRTRPGRWLTYSASDIYFSAITPSATGGQPASAYFMMKDGIPASVTTIVLLINLSMYTVSILLVGFFTAIVQPQIFMSFGILSQILIAIGCIIQIVLSAFLILLLVRSTLLHRICRFILHFLCRIRLLKREDEKLKKLNNYISEYTLYSEILKKRKKAMIFALILNVLQRASVISVSLFVFLAAGGELSAAGNIWTVQAFSIIGSSPVPIPGSMGVSDYIMLDGFGKVISYSSAVNLELLSRTISFYISVLLSGLAVLINYLKVRKKNDRIL